MYMSLGF